MTLRKHSRQEFKFNMSPGKEDFMEVRVCNHEISCILVHGIRTKLVSSWEQSMLHRKLVGTFFIEKGYLWLETVIFSM